MTSAEQILMIIFMTIQVAGFIYLEYQKSQIKKTEKEAFACPVCMGKGIVPNGFYNSPGTNTWSTRSTLPHKCRSCDGNGVVFRTKTEIKPYSKVHDN